MAARLRSGITVLLQVQAHHRLDAQALIAVEVTPRDEMVGQRPGAVTRPRLEGRDELHLVNQAVLKRKQPEE